MSFAVRGRRGFLLIESMAGLVLLLVLVSLTAGAIRGIASARIEAERRQWAIEAASNVMEAVAALPRQAFGRERLGALALDSEVSKELPEASLTIDVGEADRDGLREVVVAVSWRSISGKPATARLIAWFATSEGARR